jgi:hypothetical protein
MSCRFFQIEKTSEDFVFGCHQLSQQQVCTCSTCTRFDAGATTNLGRHCRRDREDSHAFSVVRSSLLHAKTEKTKVHWMKNSGQSSHTWQMTREKQKLNPAKILFPENKQCRFKAVGAANGHLACAWRDQLRPCRCPFSINAPPERPPLTAGESSKTKHAAASAGGVRLFSDPSLVTRVPRSIERRQPELAT